MSGKEKGKADRVNRSWAFPGIYPLVWLECSCSLMDWILLLWFEEREREKEISEESKARLFFFVMRIETDVAGGCKVNNIIWEYGTKSILFTCTHITYTFLYCLCCWASEQIVSLPFPYRKGQGHFVVFHSENLLFRYKYCEPYVQ